MKTKDINTIEPGKTSKSEILERFGMPQAIAIRGKDLEYLNPNLWNKKIQGDVFFEFFAQEHKVSYHHRIYHYYQSNRSGHSAFLLFFIGEVYKINAEQLWLLVNERTGIVEDYFYRPAGGIPLAKRK